MKFSLAALDSWVEEQDSIILVGGAAGLIGKAVVAELVERGASVIGIDKQEIGPILSSEKNYFHVIGDATSKQFLGPILELLRPERENFVGAFFAAYPRSDAWFEHSIDDSEILREDIVAQLGGAITFAKSCFQRLAEAKHGTIVLLGSIYGSHAPRFEDYPGTLKPPPAEYAAIKGGLRGFIRWLAKKGISRQVRVNLVSPGGVEDDQDPVFKQRYGSHTLSSKMLNPQSVAGVVVFLLSRQAKDITGQDLIVDSGWSL